MDIEIKGKTYKVYLSDRKNKKYMIVVKGKEIHFGAKGYRIGKVGSKKWKSYCARSSGIKNKKGITANDASRSIWNC
jgi:hypothetical protein